MQNTTSIYQREKRQRVIQSSAALVDRRRSFDNPTNTTTVKQHNATKALHYQCSATRRDTRNETRSKLTNASLDALVVVDVDVDVDVDNNVRLAADAAAVVDAAVDFVVRACGYCLRIGVSQETTSCAKPRFTKIDSDTLQQMHTLA